MCIPSDRNCSHAASYIDEFLKCFRVRFLGGRKPPDRNFGAYFFVAREEVKLEASIERLVVALLQESLDFLRRRVD
jgi:hypothetical protein